MYFSWQKNLIKQKYKTDFILKNFKDFLLICHNSCQVS